jgi:hypothetical protein
MINAEVLQRLRSLAATDPTRALEITLEQIGLRARGMRERGYDFKTCLYHIDKVVQEVRAWTTPLPADESPMRQPGNDEGERPA